MKKNIVMGVLLLALYILYIVFLDKYRVYTMENDVYDYKINDMFGHIGSIFIMGIPLYHIKVRFFRKFNMPRYFQIETYIFIAYIVVLSILAYLNVETSLIGDSVLIIVGISFYVITDPIAIYFSCYKNKINLDVSYTSYFVKNLSYTIVSTSISVFITLLSFFFIYGFMSPS